MKKLLIILICFVVLSCRQHYNSKFIGKWTDGTWRHIVISADDKGYVVEDVSGGDKKYRANLISNELIVDIKVGKSTFNYISGTDQLFAGPVLFHREAKTK
ncbi:MAG TPA: hypothetical protein VIJ92_08185 [Ginsengibacter sp.]